MSVNSILFEGLSFEVYDKEKPSTRHLEAATAMIKATQGQPMLPLTEERFAEMPEYYLVFDGDDNLVGGRGITFDYGKRAMDDGSVRHDVEMGGLRSLRPGMGAIIAGGALVFSAIRNPDTTIVIASNKKSAKINSTMGGIEVTDPATELPPALFDACNGEISEANPGGVKCPDYDNLACALGLVCCELSAERGGAFFVFPPGSIPAEATTIAELRPQQQMPVVA